MSESKHSWFALRTKPRHEKIVASILRGKGYDEFLPLYTNRQRWSDRLKHVKQPLFPGYTFCRFDAESRLPILTTPGVLHVLSAGGHPVPVDDQEIEALRTIVDSGLHAEPWNFLRVGQVVRLVAGPLRGLEGILLDKRTCKLVVSVALLQRSVAVEIDRQCVTPTGLTRRAAGPLCPCH